MRRNTASLFGLIVAVAACGGEMRGAGAPPDEAGSGGQGPSIDAGAGGGVEPGDAASGGAGGLLPHSGSRITVSGWVGEGGPLGVEQVRDTKTGVPCEPRLAEDGTTRCLPLPSSAALTLYFLDAACTEPIFLAAGECTSDGGYGTYDAGGICGVTRVARRGGSVAAPEKVYVGTTGNCFGGAAAGGPWFEAIPSPPDEWTLLERELVPVTDQLGVELWSGADGSRLVGGPRLLPEDVACEPVRVEADGDAPGTLRCMPGEHVEADTGVFTAGCSSPALVRAAECLSPRVVPFSEGLCGTSSYNEIGKQVPVRDIHWMLNGLCEPTPASWLAGFDYYELGQPVNIARYPKLEHAPADSGMPGRAMLVSEGKEVLPFDAVGLRAVNPRSGDYCGVRVSRDGKLRCVDALDESVYFSDAACTEPLAVLSACDESHSPPRWVVRWGDTVWSTGACSSTYSMDSVREIGAEYTGPVYSINGAACEPALQDPTQRYFELGAEVPIPDDAFPAIDVAPL